MSKQLLVVVRTVQVALKSIDSDSVTSKEDIKRIVKAQEPCTTCFEMCDVQYVVLSQLLV